MALTMLGTALELEYDLLVVSAADYEHDDPLFRTGNAAFEAGDTAAQRAALNAHTASALAYVTDRFSVTRTAGPARRRRPASSRSAAGRACRTPICRSIGPVPAGPTGTRFAAACSRTPNAT